MMACLVAFREEAADEALLALARSGLAVEPLGPEAAYEVAELRALGNAEGEEVVAVEVGAFVTGFREVVEDAVADGWIFREGSEGPECREQEGREDFGAGAADGLEVREVALEPCERVRLDLEAEAGGVADGAEDAGGVVPKGALVEDADEARVEVRAATGQVEDLAGFGAAQAECEGVDGEVAAEEVFSDRGGLDGGEGAWADIRLGAGGDQVDVEAREADRSRKEGRVENR